MTRSKRRAALTRKKKWAARVVKSWGRTPDAYLVGRTAEHPTACSGPCCGNPRRWFGGPTRKELAAEPAGEDDADARS